MLSRRTMLSALGLLPAASAAAQGGWYDLVADDGKPVANLRLPVELFGRIDGLAGAIRAGARRPEVTLVEFHDYNCPFCRRAAQGMAGLLKANRDLQVVHVNNPILSGDSRAAARVELGVLKLAGNEVAHRFIGRLYALSGRMTGIRALEAAVAMGLDRARVIAAAAAEDVTSALDSQSELASAMGLAATPSFVIAAAGILGYPGPKTLARVIRDARDCELIVCKG